ncbi:class I SAM-dependent methyltransferase [Flaviaesturariibacter amylovorans]|uniref:Class I SAM-dependent methyltransferase n=1 Tax=Flaviaesturariibacter amylovorans TaxID=1084520 RepID=A0ABP8H3F9_9BACT
MKNINDDFFFGSYREAWRQTIPPGLTEAETDLIMEVCALGPGKRVADLMCGYGRHALELARRGCSVTAVDNSEPYIEELQRIADEASLPVAAICAPILEWAPAGSYDALICMGNSFAFFNESDSRTLLRRFADALVPGGQLLINTWMIAEIAYKHFKEREWHELPEFRYLIANRFLLGPARIESEHILINRANEVETLQAVDYIFTIRELEAMMAGAGLRLGPVFSTPRKRPFQLGDGRAYLFATKM